ncbi:CubicO group peptidase, beta-lactamase class C family [Parasphingorhabdus marina DSM 22363]|uniref:CubicO group peptidase, beta-lactamase class C family n=1 Tax=Parasphingorhabdus marina DSM 22363 TaxID=1123272 RepID=A0A1N6CM09_9SPHN|nr:serine hydrolase domain-containing protein [Parasphingorhabdus marina]SIN59590.1 CubicO group peptidase, beta-lactamase class C family [Parasphingorhabdus marina DSM 22363]
MSGSQLRSVLAIWLSVVLALAPAQSAPPPLTAERIAEIDSFVEQRMADLAVPGVAIALIADGEIVHARGFGVTHAEGEPVTENTAFMIGSISKPFTATAILQLADQGVLGLDDPVVQHLPWFRTREKSRSDAITIRHLLSHRSGLSMFDGNRNQDGVSNAADALEQVVRDMANLQLVSAPGARYQYSNANYQILGLLLEQLGGRPYEDAVTASIITPETMPDSGAGQLQPGTAGAALGHRYWLTRPQLYRGEIGRAVVAQGGVHASSRDLAGFLIHFLNRDGHFLSPEMQDQMLTPSEPGSSARYALGWFVRDFDDDRLVFHTGSNPGYQSIAGFSPEHRYGFVVLANATTSFGNREIGRLTWGVGNLMMGQPVPPASPDILSRIAYFGICLFPLFMVMVMIGFLTIRKKLVPVSGKFRSSSTITRLLLPSLILAGIAWLLLFGIPRANGAPMSAISLFNPDLGLLLQTGGYLALFWAAVRPFLRWGAGRA